MIVISFVFGVKYDLGPISELAKKHNLIIFEDCAESFTGRSYTGDPNSDVSVFSFGPIKHATAFGGAVMIVNNNSKLVAKMRRIHAAYPV